MLAETFSFSVRNDSGSAFTSVQVEYWPWKFQPDGTKVYGLKETFTTDGSANDNEDTLIGTVDNTVNKNDGAHINVTFTGGGAGPAMIYLMLHAASKNTIPLVGGDGPGGAAPFGAEI